ncbi:MAG TPA: ATP-dependent DNA helicase RecQ [Candidatus Kapabacteria bacterium]|jgi:ATP-dependent DNA helicase RecQ
MDALASVLQERFRLSEFRPMQREVIDAVLQGRDTFVVMPTGGGKSLCYQLPALLLPGITLVISPLIALMQDQVSRLTSLGISAVALNSTRSFAETRALVRRAQTGQIKLLFVAPERLESGLFREELSGLPISLLAIDEAHCISEWGHDFRTSYRRIPDIYASLNEGRRAPILALTATATPEVRADVIQLLKLEKPFEVVTGFERPNIAYGVLRECDKDARLHDIIRSLSSGSAIVYAATRRSVDRLALDLQRKGYSAEAYHAGLPNMARKQTQERFLSSQTRVIVATSAFGMGIDKADVRTVVHYDIPGSLESYYQESGRAGRDGLPAQAVLFYNKNDRGLQEMLIRSSAPTEAEVKAVYTTLHEIAGNPLGARYAGILTVTKTQLVERLPQQEKRASTESILEALVKVGHVDWHRGLSQESRARLTFTATRQRIDEMSFKSSNRGVKQTIAALLRTVGASDAFEKEVFFDADAMIERQSLDRDEFKTAIRTIESLGLVRYTPAIRSKSSDVYHLSLTTERVTIPHLNVGGRALEERYKANIAKLDDIVAYATEWDCRQRAVLRYFGEHWAEKVCGVCDVCTAKARKLW